MTFPDIFFFTVLILTVIGLVLLWRWLNAYMSTLAITPEKRVLFAIIILALAAFLALSQLVKLNQWRRALDARNPPASTQADAVDRRQATQTLQTAPPTPAADKPSSEVASVLEKPVPEKPQTEEERLTGFIRENYSGLYEKMSALSGDIRDQEDFTVILLQLKQQNPKQAPLLDRILQFHREAYQTLTGERRQTTLRLQDFWAHYNTGDKDDALKKFAPVARQLVRDIDAARGDAVSRQRQETDLLATQLREVSAQLRNNKLPSASLGIRPYSEANRQQLMDWAEAGGAAPGLIGQLGQLVEMRRDIRDSMQRLNAYANRYPNLRDSLSRTWQLWNTALQHNYYAEYRLLFTLELKYTLETLDLSGQVVASLKQLDDTLRASLPRIMDNVQNRLQEAQDAYSPQ